MRKVLGKILLIVVPVIAAFFMLYPTYRANQLDSKQADYLARAKKAKSSSDSLAIMEEFKRLYGEDLKKNMNAKLKLGLDLRGGMYVTLEVDIAKLIEESAQAETVDETFNEVIRRTRQEAKSSEEKVIDIFLRNFNAIARPKGKSLISYFDIGDIKDISEEKIIKKLNENADQAIEQAQEVIRQRIDQYGVAEPNIQKQGTRRVVLELPGVSNEAEMRNLLSTTARLEFKLVRNNAEIVKAFARIDKVLSDQAKRRKGMKVEETAAVDSTAADTTAKAETAEKAVASKKDVKQHDTAKSTKADSGKKGKEDNPYEGLSETEAKKRYVEDHPLTSLFSTMFIAPNGKVVPVYFKTNQYPDGEYMFRIQKNALDRFKEILARPEIRQLVPVDLQIAIDAKPDQRIMKQSNVEIFDFYALKKDAELTGDVVTDARASFDQSSNAPVVLMQMNSDGSERWARITGANLKKRVAIVLDDRVYSAPTVQSKITGGSSQITGMANAEEARLLEIVLKAGALKAPVQIVEERVVGPSLGEDSIKSGLWASLGAALVVILYMLMYYSVAGLIADFAVLLNILLIIAVMAALHGTLSLPGIGGIILTLGMAVDANVLIYERIREELYRGRSYKSAVDEGFSKAMSAIVDSNVTTFLTSLILYYFGTGPIQGFALTTMIGIGATLFTAIMISRAIIEMLLEYNIQISFGESKKLLENN